jgi:hypothetical protein
LTQRDLFISLGFGAAATTFYAEDQEKRFVVLYVDDGADEGGSCVCRIELGEVLHGAKTAIFAHVVKKIAVFVCFKA